MEQKQYKVCITCYTYNQKAYILDTLNGFVVQQTSFPYIILLVDDASTDGGQQVIGTYLSQHFDCDGHEAYSEETSYAHITYARHKTNSNCYIATLFLKENHYSLSRPKLPYLAPWRDNSQYEALCEGDDYWTDPQKLQKQVEYLDAHPRCGLVYTRAQTYNQHTRAFGNIIGIPCTTFEQLLQGNGIPTLTTMYPIAARQGFTNCIAGQQFLMGDYPLWLYISLSYEIHFIDRVTSVYRVLPNSASHSPDYRKAKQFLHSTLHVKQHFIARSGRKELQAPTEEAMAYEFFHQAWTYRQYHEVVTLYHTLAPHYRQKSRNIKRYLISYIRHILNKIFRR